MRSRSSREKSFETRHSGGRRSSGNVFRKLRAKQFSPLGPISESGSVHKDCTTPTGTSTTSELGAIGRRPENAYPPQSPETTFSPSSKFAAVSNESPGTMRKRILRLFRPKPKSDCDDSSDANGMSTEEKPSQEISKSEEALLSKEEEGKNRQTDVLAGDDAAKERATRLYAILNQKNASGLKDEKSTGKEGRALQSGITRLESIPERNSTSLSSAPFGPFNWEATFGCTVPETNDAVLSPPLSPTTTHSAPSSPHISSTETSSAMDLKRSSDSTSTFGSTPLYFEDANVKAENGISSPLFTALNKLDEAFRDDPNASALPTCTLTENKNEGETAPKMEKAENPRIESYRLGYLFAQVGLPEEGKGEESPIQESPLLVETEALSPPGKSLADGPATTGSSFMSVVQSIKMNAATEELANSSLARVAADFAAVNDSIVDREALERGYLRRVTEVARSNDNRRIMGANPSKRSSAEAVKHAKRQLREIEAALDAPLDPSRSEVLESKPNEWPMESKSTDCDNDQQVTAVESALNQISRDSRQEGGNRYSGTIANLLSFFKWKEEEDDEDCEAEGSDSDETSSSGSSRDPSRASSRSQSSGIDISVPSRVRFPGDASEESSVVDESLSQSSGSSRSCESSISSHAIDKNQSRPSVASDDVRLSHSIRSEVSLHKQVSQPKGRARPLTPLGFLSFCRVVSKAKSADSEIRSVDNEKLLACASDSHDEVDETVKKQGKEKQSLETTPQFISSTGTITEEARSKGLCPNPVDSKRKFLPMSLFKHTKTPSKPPLNPVTRVMDAASPSIDQSETSASETEEKQKLVPMIVVSQAGDGSECIELYTLNQVADAAEAFDVVTVCDGNDDAVAHEVERTPEPRICESVDLRDAVESRHSQSQSFANAVGSTFALGEGEERDSPPEVRRNMSLTYQTVSDRKTIGQSRVFAQSQSSEGLKECSEHERKPPLVNDVVANTSSGIRSGVDHGHGPGGSPVLETGATDPVGATDDVDLLGILVGSESRLLWRRQETGRSSSCNDGVSDEDEGNQSYHGNLNAPSVAQSEPQLGRAASRSSVRSSKPPRHGVGASSHRRALSVPSTTPLLGSDPRASAE